MNAAPVQLNSSGEIYVPVWKHATLFLWGWMIFCLPQHLISRIMVLVWLTQVQRGEPSKLNERFLSGPYLHTVLRQ